MLGILKTALSSLLQPIRSRLRILYGKGVCKASRADGRPCQARAGKGGLCAFHSQAGMEGRQLGVEARNHDLKQAQLSEQEAVLNWAKFRSLDSPKRELDFEGKRIPDRKALDLYNESIFHTPIRKSFELEQPSANPPNVITVRLVEKGKPEVSQEVVLNRPDGSQYLRRIFYYSKPAPTSDERAEQIAAMHTFATGNESQITLPPSQRLIDAPIQDEEMTGIGDDEFRK